MGYDLVYYHIMANMCSKTKTITNKNKKPHKPPPCKKTNTPTVEVFFKNEYCYSVHVTYIFITTNRCPITKQPK